MPTATLSFQPKLLSSIGPENRTRKSIHSVYDKYGNAGISSKADINYHVKLATSMQSHHQYDSKKNCCSIYKHYDGCAIIFSKVQYEHAFPVTSKLSEISLNSVKPIYIYIYLLINHEVHIMYFIFYTMTWLRYFSLVHYTVVSPWTKKKKEKIHCCKIVRRFFLASSNWQFLNKTRAVKRTSLKKRKLTCSLRPPRPLG